MSKRIRNDIASRQPYPILAVFAGFPSAGKSSAINALTGKNFALTGMGRTTKEVVIYGALPLPLLDNIAITHIDCKLMSDDGFPFHLIDLPGYGNVQESCSDDMKMFDDLTNEWVAEADIIYWLSDARTAFNTTHEKACFDKIIADAKVRNAQTGILQKIVIMLTKYDEPSQEIVNEANIESDSESSDNREIKCTSLNDVNENTTFRDALSRVTKMYSHFWVETFNAHGRIRHFPRTKISTALKTLIEKLSPEAHETHLEFALKWYVTYIKYPSCAREKCFLNHWRNYVSNGIGTAESATNAFKKCFRLSEIKKCIDRYDPYIRRSRRSPYCDLIDRIMDECAKWHNADIAEINDRLHKCIPQGCFAEYFAEYGSEHLDDGGFLAPAFIARSPILYGRICSTTNKLHAMKNNACVGCKGVVEICQICNTKGTVNDNHLAQQCSRRARALAFFDLAVGLQIPKSLEMKRDRSGDSILCWYKPLIWKSFKHVMHGSIDDVVSIKLSLYLKCLSVSDILELIKRCFPIMAKSDDPICICHVALSYNLQNIFKLLTEMNINASDSQYVTIETYFWRLYSKNSQNPHFIKFPDAKYKPLSNATKLVEALIKDHDLIASIDFLELVKTERIRLWGETDSEKCNIPNIAARSIHNPCLLMAPTDKFAFSL